VVWGRSWQQITSPRGVLQDNKQHIMIGLSGESLHTMQIEQNTIFAQSDQYAAG
jgi:hypothetical protein